MAILIELPEALALAGKLNKAIAGKTVEQVLPPTKEHKFCWFAGDAAGYDARLRGQSFCGAEGFGMFLELAFSGGTRLCFCDGVNCRFIDANAAPKDYQLLIHFTDGTALVMTVAMYGGIYLHDGGMESEYYLKSRNALSPFSDGFSEHYGALLSGCKPGMSAKAFLATEQRFPGIGNGSAQDILFVAGINPKRKLGSLNDEDRRRLAASIISVLREMTERGGRDTEKDIFGQPGGYHTRMSKNALAGGCPVCCGEIVKEQFLGGAVYYCPVCQPLD